MSHGIGWGQHLMEHLVRYVMAHTVPANEATVRTRVEQEQAENAYLVERLRAERLAWKQLEAWEERRKLDD